MAIVCLDKKIVQFLLQQGLNASGFFNLTDNQYGHINSALHLVVAIVNKIIQERGPINLKKLEAIVSLLLSCGALKEIENNEGLTASAKARQLGFNNLADYIDQYTFDFSLVKEMLCDYRNLSLGRKTYLNNLIKAAGKVSDIHDTVLKILISNKNLDILTLLLKAGVSPSIDLNMDEDEYGSINSVIHFITFLLNKEKNKHVDWCLAFYKLRPVLDLFIHQGAPLDRKNAEGKTASEKARELGMYELATYIDTLQLSPSIKIRELFISTLKNINERDKEFSSKLNELKDTAQKEEKDSIELIELKKRKIAETENSSKLIKDFILENNVAPKELALMLPLALKITTNRMVLASLLELGTPMVWDFDYVDPDYGTINSALHYVISEAYWVHKVFWKKESPEWISAGGNRYKKLLTLFLTYGAPKDLPNKEGKTASERARELGFDELASCIEEFHN